ncbi:hypothetical protein V5O48_019037 [Marasmius crinis-equi]|uniref:Amino acid transporter transmembrane domain-containing protein n=1 Tax=Marasmius crinis-equi TaxID=585013 RepID=A0ABR3EJN5_9AGAR
MRDFEKDISPLRNMTSNEKDSPVSHEKRESVPNERLGSDSPQTLDREPTLREYIRFAAISRSKENAGPGGFREPPGELSVLEKSGVDIQEMDNARRALRAAGWVSIFYLITTDILGPFNAPFAFSQVGYVPGTILYIVMGAAACYTGLLLNRLFCKLDSFEYPVRTYADLGGRIFGHWFKHMCTALQTLQLIVNVGTICLSNGQAVEQIAANHKFCFSVSIIIWTLVGMVIGQIRTLKSYGWLANSAVWMNLIIIFTSMGFVAHSPPNFAAAKSSLGVEEGPIMREAFVSLPLFSKVNGIMNMVFAYGGAMIFPEFMAEMRRPMDFWKGMICAQALISTVYLLYGLYVYSFQGQFTLPLAFQGVSKQSWQDVGNIIALITGIIAAGLYGNIGISTSSLGSSEGEMRLLTEYLPTLTEVAYYQIVEGWFHGPSFLSRKGNRSRDLLGSRQVFLPSSLPLTTLIPPLSIPAFIIASAIPQVQTISGLIAAICIMQFTYTFPPLFWLGYQIRIYAEGFGREGMDAAAAAEPGEATDPGDTYRSWSRWKRGIFGGNWMFNLFNLILFLGSAAMAGLGEC